ncbi:hypothetical protein [Streptomyces sp. bgisy027]|uniref:hypothetical protein n=1 Tax=unclassified Streptomyces TaxID=2593676 RepID=UPI003D707865
MGFQAPGADPGREPGDGSVPVPRLRVRFQERGDAAAAAGVGRMLPEAARRGYARIALVVATGFVVVTGVRLATGSGFGVWAAFYLVGAGVSALGSVLARKGRTRRSAWVIVLGVGLALLGDNPVLR